MVDKTNFKTKADDCMAQAEKKLKGKNSFPRIFIKAASLRI